MACRTAGRLRFIVPTWTIFPYFRVASTILRPSHTVWEDGFSTYTCLPAWSAQMLARACQWFGVAMMTPSMSLSSKTRRMSFANPGLKVARSFSSGSAALFAKRFSSTSHRVLISTPGTLAKPCLSESPWPRMPIEARTTRSFAPRTRSAAPATTAAAVRDVVAVNCRRLISLRSVAMKPSFVRGQDSTSSRVPTRAKRGSTWANDLSFASGRVGCAVLESPGEGRSIAAGGSRHGRSPSGCTSLSGMSASA